MSGERDRDPGVPQSPDYSGNQRNYALGPLRSSYSWSGGRVRRRNGPGRRCRVTIETGGDGRPDDSLHSSPIQVRNYESTNDGYSRRRPELQSPISESRVTRTRLTLPEDSPLTFAPEEPVNQTLQAPLSPVSSDDNVHQDYDFQIPKTPRVEVYSEDVDFPLPDSDTSDSDRRSSKITNFRGPMTEMRISRSRWLGSTYDRGDLGGEITVTSPAAYQSEKPAKPLMKWYHLERQMMSLEEFMVAVESVLQVQERVHRDVIRLLRDVQKKFEQQRQNGRDIEPNCVSDCFYSDPVDRNKQTASVTFLAFPYHCLERYDTTQMKVLEPGSPLHPLRPMLQAHFNSTSEKRELAQVVTTMKSTKDRECLHVSQIWAIIVNGSTIVTCGRLPFESMSGRSIQVSTAPVQDAEPFVKVSLGSDRAWRIPVTSQTTWPQFLSLFDDRSDGGWNAPSVSTSFKSPKGFVNGRNWSSIVQIAQRAPMEFEMKQASPPNKSGLGSSRDPDQGWPENRAGAENRKNLPWGQETPVASKLPPSYGSLELFQKDDDPSALKPRADSLDRILSSNSRSREREAYSTCPTATVADINNWLANSSEISSESDAEHRLRKYKGKIVTASRLFFTAFWPIEFDHPMTNKFWGALHHVLIREDRFLKLSGNNDDAPRHLYAASSVYNVLWNSVCPALAALTNEFLTFESDLRPLPDAFSKAWLHFITTFVLISQTALSEDVSLRDSPVGKHLDAVAFEIDAGRNEAVTRLRTSSLEDLEICMASSLIALVICHVSQDITHGRPDVSATYNNYYQTLEFNVTQDPLPRTHQEKIRFFLQEIEAIMATLEQQLSVIDVYRQSLAQQSSDEAAFWFEGMGESRQSVVIELSRAAITSRINKFAGLKSRADELSEWHRNEMETNRDQQEAAIMVFTIVTIIFLPLSFVSSVFGMNTKDIRDTHLNQWAFWAAAVPITIVVVTGSVWWAGFFDGLGSWVSNALAGSQDRNGLERLADTVIQGSSPDTRSKRQKRRDQFRQRSDYVESLLPPPAQQRRKAYPS